MGVGKACGEPALSCWGQLRWQCSEKCSCCQLKHFSGFCLVRHKLHVCVLAVRHWGNHGGNMFLSGLAASSGLCCEDFSQESVKLFLPMRLVDQGCLCSERIQIPRRGFGTAGSPCHSSDPALGVPEAVGKDLLERGWSLPRDCWRSPVLALACRSSAHALHLSSGLPG